MNWKEILGLGTSGGLAAGPIGIAAGVGTGVLGSILGSKSQSEANKMNLQIARETNEANTAINQANLQAQRENVLMQNQFNAEEAQKARDFSSPLQQARMKMLAGINPLQDAGGSTANMASGVSAAIPSSIPMQSTRVEPVSNQLALVGQILKDVSISSAQLRTTERGQNINKAIQDESNRLKAADIRVKNELGSMAQAETERMGVSQRALNESLVKTGNLEAQKMRLDLENYDKVLQSSLDLNDAQIASFYGGVRNSAAAVNATLADIAARLQMNHNDRSDAMSMFAAQLEQDMNKFITQMALNGKYYELSEMQISNAIEMSLREFEAQHGGLNVVWDWLGIHPRDIIGAVSQVYLGKAFMNAPLRLPPTKQTNRSYYNGGYMQYETYYPNK